MATKPSQTTQRLLDQIAAISTMERGKLTGEYRTGLSPQGADPPVLGPYYKLQVRENGRKASRRVHERFRALTTTFTKQTIARTRAPVRHPSKNKPRNNACNPLAKTTGGGHELDAKAILLH